MPTPSLPPVAALVRHPVADFDTWKEGFDAHEQARRDAGILGHHLNRDRDDPNAVTIYLAASDLDRARAFADSDDLKQIMQEVGVTAPPVITWVKPVREAIVWDGTHPAFVLSHRVADFDAWLEGYDAAGELQRARGIIGHAANQSLDDPATAVVYHQADSFATLEAFLGEPDLKEAMQQAGVVSDPEISFVTGGWAKRYD